MSSFPLTNKLILTFIFPFSWEFHIIPTDELHDFSRWLLHHQPDFDYVGRSSKETSARHRGTAGCLMKISLDRLLSVQFHMPRLPDVLALLEARIRWSFPGALWIPLVMSHIPSGYLT